MAAKKKQAKFKFESKHIPAFGGLLVAALIAAVGIVYLDPTYAAKREGKGKPVAGACTVDPNSVAAGEKIHLVGSGMPTSSVYDIFIGDPNGNITWKEYGQGTLDGNIIYSPAAPTQPGQWTYYFASHKVSSFDFKGRQVYAACSMNVTES